ncbi:hypothetical protein MTP03_27940 [Tsukamurella sp. PLM1]|nr:hypothetical protein MTP03_27940 [Tsukamurella sp. PLM1]
MTVRVLVADDDPIVREYLRAMLSSETGLDVVATAADGAAAVEGAIAHQPDVALLDVRMPGVDGIVATRALRELDPPVAVVLITTLDTDAVLVDGLAAGAAGFVVKTAEPALLASAVRTAAAGGSLLSPTPSADWYGSRATAPGSTIRGSRSSRLANRMCCASSRPARPTPRSRRGCTSRSPRSRAMSRP